MDAFLIADIRNPLGKPVEVDPGGSRDLVEPWRTSSLFRRRNRHCRSVLPTTCQGGHRHQLIQSPGWAVPDHYHDQILPTNRPGFMAA